MPTRLKGPQGEGTNTPGLKKGPPCQFGKGKSQSKDQGKVI